MSNFHENDYDRIDVVKTLTESDLKEIGIQKLVIGDFSFNKLLF